MDKGFFEYGKYGSIGIAWVLSTAIYVYLGFKGGTYLDDRLETAPIFLIVGLLFGLGLSIKSLIDHILALTSENDHKNGGGGSDRRVEDDKSASDRENNNKG